MSDDLGEKIIIRLYEKNKSQKWLAQRCNVTPSVISMIINGKRKPSKKLLYGISKELNIPFEIGGH